MNPEDLVNDMAFKDDVCPKCGALVIIGEDGPICNCTLKKEQPAPVEEKKEAAPSEPKQEETPVFDFRGAISKMSGAPSEAQIQQWKSRHGAVYSFAFDTTRDLFIWRPIVRSEWAALRNNAAVAQDEEKFQEQVVVRCVLWPAIGPVELKMMRAGLIPTLFNVIAHGSYFLPLEFALSRVGEL